MRSALLLMCYGNTRQGKYTINEKMEKAAWRNSVGFLATNILNFKCH